MRQNGFGSMQSEGINRGSNHEALKCIIRRLPSTQIPVTNVLTLTIGTLKGATDVVAWTNFVEPNFVLDFCQSGTIKISWYCSLKSI